MHSHGRKKKFLLLPDRQHARALPSHVRRSTWLTSSQQRFRKKERNVSDGPVKSWAILISANADASISFSAHVAWINRSICSFGFDKSNAASCCAIVNLSLAGGAAVRFSEARPRSLLSVLRVPRTKRDERCGALFLLPRTTPRVAARPPLRTFRTSRMCVCPGHAPTARAKQRKRKVSSFPRPLHAACWLSFSRSSSRGTVSRLKPICDFFQFSA